MTSSEVLQVVLSITLNWHRETLMKEIGTFAVFISDKYSTITRAFMLGTHTSHINTKVRLISIHVWGHKNCHYSSWVKRLASKSSLKLSSMFCSAFN